MSKVDKRDAAQRVMEFLREKNIRLKRADALELLAQVSDAPNWNVLQNAMRTGPEPTAVQPARNIAVPDGVCPLEYVPDHRAVYTAQARVAYGWFSGIHSEMARVCEEERQRFSAAGNAEEATRWENWQAVVQRLAATLEGIQSFCNYRFFLMRRNGLKRLGLSAGPCWPCLMRVRRAARGRKGNLRKPGSYDSGYVACLSRQVPRCG
jgi:hypothetical protein